MTNVRPQEQRTTDLLSSAVLAAQRGDEEAFRTLYHTVQPGMLRYLRALVGEDAEDVASETWLQIARDLQTFHGKEGFRAWAVRIARNRALDHLRHRRRRPAVPTPVEHLAELAANDDTGERAAELMSTDAAIALIATLPRDQAEAVLLRVVVGLDAETTAKVLGKRAGAVRTASYRGLKRLAETLRQGDAAHPASPPGARPDLPNPQRPTVSGGQQPAGVTDPKPTTPSGMR